MKSVPRGEIDRLMVFRHMCSVLLSYDPKVGATWYHICILSYFTLVISLSLILPMRIRSAFCGDGHRTGKMTEHVILLHTPAGNGTPTHTRRRYLIETLKTRNHIYTQNHENPRKRTGTKNNAKHYILKYSSQDPRTKII